MSNMLRGSLTSTTDAKGVLGFKGERGYSNYEIYVKNGGTMTEQEWLDHFGVDLTDYIKTSEVNAIVGDLEDLETTDKTDVVSAINELNTNINSLDDRDNYSTTEQVIGTWVNNKPLYQKTIYIPSPVNDGYYDHYIENADRIIVSEVTGLRNNSWNCGVFNTTNNDRLTVLAHASRSQGVYVNFAMTSLKELYVTLKYTKTTD